MLRPRRPRFAHFTSLAQPAHSFQPLGGGSGVRDKGFYRVEWATGQHEYLVEEEVVPLLHPDPNPVIPDPLLPVPWPQLGPPSLLRRRLEAVVAEGASELRFGPAATLTDHDRAALVARDAATAQLWEEASNTVTRVCLGGCGMTQNELPPNMPLLEHVDLRDNAIASLRAVVDSLTSPPLADSIHSTASGATSESNGTAAGDGAEPPDGQDEDVEAEAEAEAHAQLRTILLRSNLLANESIAQPPKNAPAWPRLLNLVTLDLSDNSASDNPDWLTSIAVSADSVPNLEVLLLARYCEVTRRASRQQNSPGTYHQQPPRSPPTTHHLPSAIHHPPPAAAFAVCRTLFGA